MSRKVPKNDQWSRLNNQETRIVSLERGTLPFVAAGEVPGLSTASASPVTTGAPSAEFTIGTSGDALIFVAATMATPAGSFADIALSLDGGPFEESMTSGSTLADLTVSNALVIRLSDIFGLTSPGQHSMQASLSASAGVTVHATFFSLAVIPL